MLSNFPLGKREKVNMIGVGVIIATLGIVGLLILGMFRTGSFPPNARLLCDAWSVVEQKMKKDNKRDDKVLLSKKDLNQSSEQEV
jgi:hypothetical protein